MDIIVIGKKDFGLSAPTVIYCGQSRDESRAAVAKTAGRFPNIYEVNSQPYARVTAPTPTAAVAAELARETENRNKADAKAAEDAEKARLAAIAKREADRQAKIEADKKALEEQKAKEAVRIAALNAKALEQARLNDKAVSGVPQARGTELKPISAPAPAPTK